MSTTAPQVRVPTPSGSRRTGDLLREWWAPRFNAQDRFMATVEVDGHPLTVPAEEVERV